jgi:hypothetical protein
MFLALMLIAVSVLSVAQTKSPKLISNSEPQEEAGAVAFEQLHSLAGEWEGSYEWTGARSATGKVNASYSETGNSSAIVENLSMDGVPAMTSVYHLDGANLRLTHFCAAGNQPRLKASHMDVAKGILDFAFVDATNLPSPDAPHVYGLEMRWLNADHITLAFLFEGGGKRSKELIDLKRITHKASAQ